MHWAYTGNIVFETPPDVGRSQTEEDRMRREHTEQMVHMQLYVLGDMLQDIRLRNRVLIVLAVKFRSWRCRLHISTLTYVWKNTVANASLRSLLKDRLIMCGVRESFKKNISRYPAELVQEVAATMLGQAKCMREYEAGMKVGGYLGHDSEVVNVD